MSSKSTSNSSVKFDSKTEAVIAHKGYTLKNKLGQGAFGVVFKALNREGEPTAVKVIDLSKMSQNSVIKYLPREIKTLIECRHENLIQVFDIFKANQKMFIFMEFAGNGDISGYAQKNQGIKESLACTWFFQAASGLAYLHDNLKTSHRDIKLDNMLLNDKWVAKLTDFGFAKQCIDQKKNLIMSNTFCGTLPYECPEILQHKQYNAFKADTWSMGVTIFIMLHDRFPFRYKEGRKQMLADMMNYPSYVRSRYVKKLPPNADRLIEHLLHPDEHKRGSVQTILSNPYLRSKVPN